MGGTRPDFADYFCNRVFHPIRSFSDPDLLAITLSGLITALKPQTSSSSFNGSTLLLLKVSHMAPKKGFTDFDPIFGEAKSELHHEPISTSSSSSGSHPILFHVYAIDSSRLRIVATDFLSLSWDRVLTISDLEDLRDDIGIGGTWSDFVDYVISSLSTGEVKINSSEPYVKLVAFKSKGLPRISLSLEKMEGPAVSDAKANFSVSLFQAYQNKQKDCLREQECSSQLTGLLSSEREKNEILQKQLDSLSFLSKRKVSKPKIHDTPASISIHTATGTVGNSDQALSSQEQIAPPTTVANSIGEEQVEAKKDPQPAKVIKRVAPAPRSRARKRGVSLKSTIDDDDED